MVIRHNFSMGAVRETMIGKGTVSLLDVGRRIGAGFRKAQDSIAADILTYCIIKTWRNTHSCSPAVGCARPKDLFLGPVRVQK